MKQFIDIKALDDHLSRKGVFFLPWVGKHYVKGFKGRRLLILGESHYPWEDENRKMSDPLYPELTRDCVRDAVERTMNMNFWKFIEQAHTNVERSNLPVRGDCFWNSIAFYNFVQVAVGTGPRQAPSRENFVSAHSAFRIVLDAIKPERIVVCGKRLWRNMEEVSNELFKHDFMQGYGLSEGKIVWCLATNHPSSGNYSWKKLYPLISAFIADPKAAVDILNQPI